MKKLAQIYVLFFVIQLIGNSGKSTQEQLTVRSYRDSVRSRCNHSVAALHVRIHDLYEALQKSKNHQQVVEEELKKYEV